MPDFKITVRVNGVSQDDAESLAWVLGLQASASPEKPLVGKPQRVDSSPLDPDRCPHCPDGHQPSDRRPWAAWVTEARDGDGQPTTIHVARTDCAHVAEQDAVWMRDVLNGRAARGETRTEFGTRFETGEIMARPSRELAERTVQAITSRGGDSALMVRQITTTDWTETEAQAPSEPRNCSCSPKVWHNNCGCGCGTDDTACRAAGCCSVLLADGSTLHPPARLV